MSVKSTMNAYRLIRARVAKRSHVGISHDVLKRRAWSDVVDAVYERLRSWARPAAIGADGCDGRGD